MAFTPSIPAMAEDSNPLMQPYPTKYGIPTFESIKPEHFVPAIKAGIEEQKQNLYNIVRNRAMPDFDNTILPLENLAPTLDRAVSAFGLYREALSTPEIQALSEEIVPMLNEADNMVMLDDQLFQRVKQVYDRRDEMGLTPVQKRLVEKYYKRFERQGAALSPEKKEQLVKVNDELSKLYLQYGKNLLATMNSFFITVYDEADLAGLPESSVNAAAEEAAARGLDGLWVFTLHGPSRLPVLQFADNRGLREAMYKGYTSLASTGDNSNLSIIPQIVKLRTEKAKIMGFDNYAQMATEPVMAKTPEAAEELLMQVFTPAVKRSRQEVADMQAYVNSHGGNFKIAPWDYYYYAEKVKKERYDFDESEVRPYFALDNVLKGMFECAEKLYGIKMVEMPDAPKYIDEMKVFDVQDAKTGEHIAVWWYDYFPRATKRQGAWMEALVSQGIDADGNMRRPIVYNVGNFTRPSGGNPSLLTLDEVETTFHEFGHALQGMLSQVEYPTLAGTNVDRDCVEVSSQIHEHWAMEPEVLKGYARHYKTGEPIPDELIGKIQAAGTFNNGFAITELAGAALLDMNWGKSDGSDTDVIAFEEAVGKKIGMPEEVTYRYRSPYFSHIFGDEGYASGYYTYIWAQVLEADAWDLFKEKGIFDPATAASFKKNILESGDTEDAMVLFERFRGHNPQTSALLRQLGLE